MTPCTNEKADIPGVAEGPTLFALIAVTKAYSFTDAFPMFGRMLRTARWPSKLAFVGSLLATVVAIKWRSDFGVQATAFLIVATFFWFKRDAFRA